MAEQNITLVLSSIAGKMGKQVSTRDTEQTLTDFILSAAPVALEGRDLSLSQENRGLKIDQLVGKKITPAQATALKAEFAGPQSLILSEVPGMPDAFESVMKFAESLPDLKEKKEKTGKQTLELSDDTQEKTPGQKLVEHVQKRYEQGAN